MSLVRFKRRAMNHKAVGETFDGLDLRSLYAPSSVWEDCRFEECKAGVSTWTNARLERTTFEDCSLPVSMFVGAYLVDCSFTNCDLEQASFQGAILRNVLFTGCRLAYSNFEGAQARAETRFIGSNLRGADLGFHEIDRDVGFLGSNLWSAKVQLGCQFFGAQFDEVSVQRFVALVAQTSGSEQIRAAAGEQMAVVERLMREEKEG